VELDAVTHQGEHHVAEARRPPRGRDQGHDVAVLQRGLHAGAADGQAHLRELAQALEEHLAAQGGRGLARDQRHSARRISAWALSPS
jgi:hypothetical protein